MTPQDRTERLIGGIAMGDRRAFRALYSGTSEHVLGALHILLRDEAEAEVALQDVYLRVWEEAGQYREAALSAEQWLAVLARDVAVAKLRVARAQGGVAPFGLAERLFSGDSGATIGRGGFAGSGGAQLSPEAESFAACLRRLSPDVAELLCSAWMQGLSYDELGELTGSRPDAVRQAFHAALARLRACLGGEPEEALTAEQCAAAEFALGLTGGGIEGVQGALEGAARGADGDFAQDVTAWTTFFATLTEAAEPKPVPGTLLRVIEARILGAPPPPVWRQVMPYGLGAVIAVVLVWLAGVTGVLDEPSIWP